MVPTIVSFTVSTRPGIATSLGRLVVEV
jgi:hypothetical protein